MLQFDCALKGHVQVRQVTVKQRAARFASPSPAGTRGCPSTSMPAPSSGSLVVPRPATFSSVPAVTSLPRAAGARHDGCAGAEDSSLPGRVALLHRVRTSTVSLTCCHDVRGPHAPAGSKCSHLFVEGPG